MSMLKRHPGQEETEDESSGNIDGDLRLRTVRTARDSIAESIRQEDLRALRKAGRKKGSRFFRKEKKASQLLEQPAPTSSAPAKITGVRRNVYVNMSLAPSEADQQGEPLVRYPRNKVRTSKYTVLTFIPRNLYEQFRRVANIFFLALVVVQVFPVFGAAGASISFLPLAFILTVTAIKDAIEDYRRASLDEEVNTSAATKLGHWKNVNQLTDPRGWFEKALGTNAPGTVTKGVRKLREREASEGRRIVLERPNADRDSTAQDGLPSPDAERSRGLEDIQSADSHSYPPSSMAQLAEAGPARAALFGGSGVSLPTQTRSSGVVDQQRRVTGLARWERTLWKKLEVGDVVLLRDNEQVPADIVVLSTSDADGMCYLETKNLDGETNLKPRKAVRGTSAIMSEEDVERASFVLDSEPAHQNMYVYNGVLRYRDPLSREQKQESVTINELLLRGCVLRNTTWVIGLVLFTGSDTKIMLNGGETPSKRSKIEKETNFNVIVNFVVLLFLCTFAAVGSGIMDDKTDTSAKLFERGSDATSSSILNALVTFTSCLIAFQNIVPISLYISIEIVKTIQAYFISQDIDMYYSVLDTPCVPKTWNISDDLGQIEYVFSDKTGTLTQNIMEFQKCSINGVAYGEGVTEAQRGAAKRQGNVNAMSGDQQKEQLEQLKSDMLQRMSRSYKNRYVQPEKLTLVSPQLADDLTDRSRAQRAHCLAFFRALAICHSVLADRPDPQARPFLTEYKAESPDEAALVAAARDVGFPFINRGKDSIDIEVLGQPERYVPLRVLEFNSTRKRMSVIVRNPEGKIVLYCKGADSVVYERLAPNHDAQLKAQTAKDMEAFANGGLRTLCIAYRYLSEEEYLQWSRTYDNATAAIEHRDEEIDNANALVEHSLTILGATALEDKLQEGVPDAIETLHSAGIKLWILTGDKVQTAIEIGFSCNLLKSDMDIMILSADSQQATRSQIEAGLNKIASVLGPPSFDPRERGFMPNAKASFAVVIDGDTLRHALDPNLKNLFLNLATQCETVVCCRVSPAQKAETVKLVKEGRNAMTLSIGDGANDVAMIQEANVGCGLFGLEGSQAAMSADYAFGQFRFLTKLLIVHGRWSYQRVADMHSNFFYKNVIWTFAMFWFLPWNSFDGTYLYQYTFILLFNLVFTSLPVIASGAFDQDINAKAVMAFPQLYVRGIRGLEYTRTKFWLYMLDGLYQSAVVYFIGYFAWTLGPAVSWNGKGIDSLADFGTTVSVSAIFAANFYVGINTRYWTRITWLVIMGSCLVMILWIVAYSFFDSPDFNDEVIVLFGELTFWTTVILSVTIALTPRYIIKFLSTTYFPLDRDIIREMWVKGDLKDRLGIQHRRDRKKGEPESFMSDKEMHLRSESETSDTVGYQHVHGASPGSSAIFSPPAPVAYLHSPPQDGGPPSADGSQYFAIPSEADDPLASVPNTPHQRGRWRVSSGSVPSYYSASEIPIPSPVPQFSPTRQSTRVSKASGLQIDVLPAEHPDHLSPRIPMNYSRSPSPHKSPQRSPQLSPPPSSSPYHSPQRSPQLLPPPAAAAYRAASPLGGYLTGTPDPSKTSHPPSAFEMHVRHGGQAPVLRDPLPSPFDRGSSRATNITEGSYATAEEPWPEEDGQQSTVHGHGQQRESYQSFTPRAF